MFVVHCLDFRCSLFVVHCRLFVVCCFVCVGVLAFWVFFCVRCLCASWLLAVRWFVLVLCLLFVVFVVCRLLIVVGCC